MTCVKKDIFWLCVLNNFTKTHFREFSKCWVVIKAEIAKIVGAKIRKIRTQKGLTMEQLAFEIGIEYAQLSRIERGKINTSIFQIFLISRALEVEFEEIIEGLGNVEFQLD